MGYQGNEIYWQDGVCWAMPLNADGSFDRDNITEATETPEVVRELARIECGGDPSDPLYVLAEGEEGAYILSMNHHDGELPLVEGSGATFLAAAEALLAEARRLLEVG